MTIKATGPHQFKLLNFYRDNEVVKDFLTKNKTYLVWQDGKEINDKLVKDFFFGELPKGSVCDDKYIIGVFENDEMACVFDILKNYPRKKTWAIGLMLLDEQIRRRGVGTVLFKALGKSLMEHGAETLRLGVLEDNFIGKVFWEKMGFVETGDVKWHEDGRGILVLEKNVF